MRDLRSEPEIFPHDREKLQILNGQDYIENIHLAVGFASRCWSEYGGDGVFDTDAALRISNELCAYMRLFKAGEVT